VYTSWTRCEQSGLLAVCRSRCHAALTMVSPSRSVIGRGANAISSAGILTWASATEAPSSHNIPHQSCRDITSSVADGGLLGPMQRPKRNLYFGPAAPHCVWHGERTDWKDGRLISGSRQVAQSHLPAAPPEKWSQFFNPRDLGSEWFLGDFWSSKAIISRPEAGTPTLPPRTISLALSSRP
jgi:hypothetical protein